MPTIVDYSHPLSELLKESTKDTHKQLERSEGVRALLGGTLPKEDYILFLMMLYQVYSTLEQGLERHATHSALEPTYNPALLARTDALGDDIAYLTENTDWKSTALFKELSAAPPQALKVYTSRIQEVADKDPQRLLAHAYVRYLGDMSGGQNMRRIMAKAYALDERQSYGLSFYDFKELKGSTTAGLGELRRIKTWYRDGMNAGAGDDIARKEAIVDEGNQAFLFNAGLFDFLATDTTGDMEEDDTEDKQYAETMNFQIEGPTSSSRRGFSMSGWLTILVAVGAAHFALTVGGFTGSRGSEKLEQAQTWLGSLSPYLEAWIHPKSA